MEPKKDVLSPGVRVSEEFDRQYEEAIRYYGASHAGFVRAAMQAVVGHHAQRDEVVLPLELRVERIVECPHCRRMFLNVKAKSARGEEALGRMQTQYHPHAVLPENLAGHSTHKDVLFPGMILSSEFAEKVVAAIEKLDLSSDYTEARREVLTDLIRIAEAGEHLVRPIRMFTQ